MAFITRVNTIIPDADGSIASVLYCCWGLNNLWDKMKWHNNEGLFFLSLHLTVCLFFCCFSHIFFLFIVRKRLEMETGRYFIPLLKCNVRVTSACVRYIWNRASSIMGMVLSERIKCGFKCGASSFCFHISCKLYCSFFLHIICSAKYFEISQNHMWNVSSKKCMYSFNKFG